jgi:3'-phosphoadenosine 5'-phosphosulfate sulfotransferase (PAPS reductase)/FAD synthetase
MACEAYNLLGKTITLVSMRTDSTDLFMLSRKAFLQGIGPFPVIHIDVGVKNLNSDKSFVKSGPWYGTST